MEVVEKENVIFKDLENEKDDYEMSGLEFNEEVEYDFSRQEHQDFLINNISDESSHENNEPSQSNILMRRGEPIRNLVIELGTDKLPRYSCACHKNKLRWDLTQFNLIMQKLSHQLAMFYQPS